MAKRFWVLLGLMLLVPCVATAADSGMLSPAPWPPGMVLIPAGSFQMGDSFGEGWSDELPVQTVSVSAFWTDTVEVTKGLWDEVATWAAANGYDIGPEDGSGKAADHPVYDVSWYEAVKWANARSEKEGLTPPVLHGEWERLPYRRERQPPYLQLECERLPAADGSGVGEGGTRRGRGAPFPVE